MALIQCSECKAEISDAAIACPRCGHPRAPSAAASTVPIVPAQRATGSDALGPLLVAMPFIGVGLIWLWIGSMNLLQGPGSSLMIVGWGTIIATGIFSAVDASMLGMGSASDLNEKGKRREGPGLWLVSLALLWPITFPMYLHRRKTYGRRSLAFLGALGAAGLIASWFYMATAIDQQLQSVRAAFGGPPPSLAGMTGPTREPEPTWSYSGLGPGMLLVGSDIQPGRYRTRAAATSCYWARLGGTDGEMGSIHANDNTDGPTIVDITAGDRAFRSQRCAPWTRDLSAITSDPNAPFEDGTYLVGVDISPGTWRANNPENCYWARLADFAGGMHSILANDNGSGVVTIRAGDVGFKSSRCGTWSKIR